MKNRITMKVLIVKIKERKLAKQKKTYILNPDFYVEKSMRISFT